MSHNYWQYMLHRQVLKKRTSNVNFQILLAVPTLVLFVYIIYSKTCVKQPLKNRQNKDSMPLSYFCHGYRTIYLSTIFGTIFRHRRWLYATTYVFTFFTINLRFLLVTERDSPYRDLAEILRKLTQNSHRTVIV